VSLITRARILGAPLRFIARHYLQGANCLEDYKTCSIVIYYMFVVLPLSLSFAIDPLISPSPAVLYCLFDSFLLLSFFNYCFALRSPYTLQSGVRLTVPVNAYCVSIFSKRSTFLVQTKYSNRKHIQKQQFVAQVQNSPCRSRIRNGQSACNINIDTQY